MFKILCVFMFITKHVNGFDVLGPKIEIRNDDEDLKQKKIVNYEPSGTGSPYETDFDFKFGDSLTSPTTIIKSPSIEMVYSTHINVQQFTYPYLYKMIQMISIKGQQSYQYVFQKIFKFFNEFKKFKSFNALNRLNILKSVFPELGDKVYELVQIPSEPTMLKALFEIIFPGISKQDLDLIFHNAKITKEVIINTVLYLCPNIREHFLWKENLTIDEKLYAIFSILFPGVDVPQFKEDDDFLHKMYKFLGKFILSTEQPLQLSRPEWSSFLNTLRHLFGINYETVSKDILLYLFSLYKSPHFKYYANLLKDKIKEDNLPNEMDHYVWKQYLNDLKTHQKTLRDMPVEIKLFLQDCENPQQFIKIISDSLGFPIDASKLNLPLDPKIKQLWKKFTLDTMSRKADVIHLPQPLLDYFSSFSQDPDYKSYLDSIFDSFSINPEIVSKWNIFFDELQDGRKTLDQMPTNLITLLINNEHPEEFLRLILKLKDAKLNTSYLNTKTNPKMLQLWKQYVQDVAANKGNIQNIPDELLKYFYELSPNADSTEYIGLIFNADRISRKTLNIRKPFIDDLRHHRVDLKDKPSEIIQLMSKYSKYKSPNKFLEVVNSTHYIAAANSEIAKEEWKDMIPNLQHHNVSIHDTPKNSKDFFYKVSPLDNDYHITHINSDLLMKWKLFMKDLKQKKKSLFTMPKDLKKYLSEIKDVREFINLIFKGLEPPLDDDVPFAIYAESGWKKFLQYLNYEPIDKITFTVSFSFDLQNASNDTRYIYALNNIYQMDRNVRTKFEKFKQNMLDDYNVTFLSLPQELSYFLVKFENPADLFRSVLAAYTENFRMIDVKTQFEIFQKYFHSWKSSLISIINKHTTEISPETKYVIKFYTMGTPLAVVSDEIIKVHERNALVKRVESFWSKAKTQPKVDDGLEVFLQVLKNLGQYYSKSEELCEERIRILEVLDRVRAGFAAKSECTVNQLLTNNKFENKL